MDEHARDEHRPDVGRRRRWFVAVDPIWEAGRHGRKAETWEVEDELMAVAILGDVTIDLSQTKSSPSDIDINAYAVFRDVDVLVGEGDHVELSGGVLRGDLRNDIPSVSPERRRRVIRIHGHTLFGDVTVRCAKQQTYLRQPGDFLSGGEAWAAYRSGDIGASTFGVYGTSNFGPGEIRGNLVKDLAALNKVAVLPWDEWGRKTAAYAGETGVDYDELLDTVAAVCAATTGPRRDTQRA